ncbi:hypothetical protein QO179_25005 [Bacillus stercoris]|nr:hypothetical protein [Bacillus stercoris]
MNSLFVGEYVEIDGRKYKVNKEGNKHVLTPLYRADQVVVAGEACVSNILMSLNSPLNSTSASTTYNKSSIDQCIQILKDYKDILENADIDI